MKKSIFQSTLICISLALILCIQIKCQKQTEDLSPVVDIEAEKVNIQSVLDRWLQANRDKDIESYMKIFAPDEDIVNLGVSGERWIGWEALKERTMKSYEAIDKIDFSVRDRVIKVHASSKVAWVFLVLDINFIFQGEAISVEKVRLTGVLEKRDENWVVVQSHASIPAPEE
ncbi:MAG: SgcJ/EcaC family oxidoreductase [Candidatus Aminicenantes bacterium]|nr:SgcJ/EcaC family oxidoreductase [Candidatus Aminicenantes bacterium]